MPEARLARTREVYENELFLWGYPEKVMREWQRAMSPEDLERVKKTVTLIPEASHESD